MRASDFQLRTFALFALTASSSALVIRQQVDKATETAVEVTSPPSPPAVAGKITWGPCPDPQIPQELDCGRILVPLDHANPPSAGAYDSANSVELSISRLKAKKADGTADAPAKSLIINPGGPGVSGWTMLVYQLQGEMGGHDSAVVTPAVRQEYDLIGLDPRGTGLSQGLQCDDELLESRPDSIITCNDTFAAVAEWNKRYAESCAERSGDLVKFMDTISVVKDFEVVRNALGEDKLNLLGLSYGSQIGAEYIELYPEQVGRFVLDGILDHSPSAQDLVNSDATAFESTLEYYSKWCANKEECRAILQTAPSKPNDALQLVDTLMTRLSTERIPAPDCQGDNATCVGSIGLRDFSRGVQEGLGNQNESAVLVTSWMSLTNDLVKADQGDGSAFAAPRIPKDGSVNIYGNLPHAGTAVSCLDLPRIETYEGWLEMMGDAEADNEHTKGMCWASRAITDCIGWPFAVTNPPKPLDRAMTAKSAEILLLQSTIDPSTNMDWAEGLQDQLPKSRMVIREGAGHTSFTLHGEAGKIGEQYLLTGEFPAQGTSVSS